MDEWEETLQGSNEPDTLDRAAIATLQAASIEIKRVREAAAAISTLNATGECWHCFEPTSNERRWCNAVCCKQWSMEN